MWVQAVTPAQGFPFKRKTKGLGRDPLSQEVGHRREFGGGCDSSARRKGGQLPFLSFF